MIKHNRGFLILTTLIILIPMVTGLLLWNRLPEQIPTHWNAEGQIDGWSSKAFAVFGLPLFMEAVHWVCVLATAADPKAKGHSRKILNLVFWICPVVSLLMAALVYPAALGFETFLSTPLFMSLLLGAMFLYIGNYLPKCKQSYTIGIRLPWTLDNEENWNKTHRFSGWLWTIGGCITMITAFFGSTWLIPLIILAMILIPTIYSYFLYRKYKKGTA